MTRFKLFHYLQKCLHWFGQIKGRNKPWREVDKQIPIGRDGGKARVYIRENPSEGNVAVLIGLKKNQKKDFDYLSSFSHSDGIEPRNN